MDYSLVSKRGDRKLNEDFVDTFTTSGRRFFIVADGLGGQGYGEVASKEAVCAAKNYFVKNAAGPLKEIFEGVFNEAHYRLRELQNEASDYSSFKTTFTVLAVERNIVFCGYIGDTRVYHFENGFIKDYTKDHSVPQLLADLGEIDEDEIRLHPKRHCLTRVLGDDDEIMKPSVCEIKREKYDAFIICTDGFWESVDEKYMEYSLQNSADSREWIELMLKEIENDNSENNTDNYSLIAIIV